MTDPDSLLGLAKDFGGRLRDHISATAQAEPDEAVERFIGAAAAVVGAVFMVLPGKSRENLAMALVVSAARHYARRPVRPPVELVK